MKMQIRSILFALILPVAACGGDKSPMVNGSPMDYIPKSTVVSPDVSSELPRVTEPVAVVKPVVGETQGDQLAKLIEAAKASPKKAEPQIELARMYISMNERGLAITAANKAIKLAPDSSQAWNTKGRAELNAKNYENAITAFTKAVELNPDNAFAWNNLGYTELLLKRYDDAIDHLTEATEKKDATGFMFNNLGTALEHQDKLDDARLAYEAGGKLGSKEASMSRKRLEGVDTIVIEQTAKVEPVTVDGKVESKNDGAKVYDLTDEGDETGDTTEEPAAEAVKAADASDGVDGSGSDDSVDETDEATTPVEAPPSDTATE